MGSMKVETAETDANRFKRAAAAMRVLIKIFLVLDFVFIGVKIFHV